MQYQSLKIPIKYSNKITNVNAMSVLCECVFTLS